MSSRDRPVTLLIFPHQLFEDHPGLRLSPDNVFMIEDSLFFGDPVHPARFHKQKLWLHRASMTRYRDRLRKNGIPVEYIEYQHGASPLRNLFHGQLKGTTDLLVVADVHDDLLRRRLKRLCDSGGIDLEWLETPMFLNSPETNAKYREGKKRWFMADFYKFQRRRLDILMEDGSPKGGEWSFDAQNRKKVPKSLLNSLPELSFPKHDEIDLAARSIAKTSECSFSS